MPSRDGTSGRREEVNRSLPKALIGGVNPGVPPRFLVSATEVTRHPEIPAAGSPSSSDAAELEFWIPICDVNSRSFAMSCSSDWVAL